MSDEDLRERARERHEEVRDQIGEGSRFYRAAHVAQQRSDERARLKRRRDRFERIVESDDEPEEVVEAAREALSALDAEEERRGESGEAASGGYNVHFLARWERA